MSLPINNAAVGSSGYPSTSDVPSGITLSYLDRQDLSDVMDAIYLSSNMFDDRIGSGPEVFNDPFFWQEDDLLQNFVTLTAAAAVGGTSLTVAATDGALIDGLVNARHGYVYLYDRDDPSGENIVVTAESGGTLTCSALTAAHASGAKLYFVGRTPYTEYNADQIYGFDSTYTALSPQSGRTARWNTLQQFQKDIHVTDRAVAFGRGGRDTAVPDEFKHQLTQRMLEMKNELAKASYIQERVAAGSRGTFGGVRYFLKNGSLVNATAEPISGPVLDKLYLSVWETGADSRDVWGPPDQIRPLAKLHEDKVRYAAMDTTRGTYVQKYLCDMGVELNLQVDRWMLKSDLMLVDMNRIKRRFRTGGGQMAYIPYAKISTSVQGVITCDVALEVRLPDKAHALHSHLTVA